MCRPPADVEGVMTTIGCDGGRPLLWERHRERLLAFPRLAVSSVALPKSRDLEVLLAAVSCMGPARLRVSVWRDKSSILRVEAVCSELESFGPAQEPVWLGRLCWSDPPEAGHKIIARHPWRDAGARAVSWGGDDALIVDGEGRLLETSKANIFVRRGLVVATPPAPERCLPGIMRHAIMKILPTMGLKVLERDIFFDELAFADEVWMTNAVVGILRVKRVGERNWDHWDFHRRLASRGVPAPGWMGGSKRTRTRAGGLTGN